MHNQHHNHLLPELALAGAVGLGAYELWHHHQYGTFGFGNPNNQGMNYGGYGSPYGAPYGYGQNSGYGGAPGPFY